MHSNRLKSVAGARRKKLNRIRREQDKLLARLKAPPPTKYLKYIRSTEWRLFKLTVLAQRGAYCQRCGGPGHLDLHHLTYERLYAEKPEDVILLCRDCHAGTHGKVA